MEQLTRLKQQLRVTADEWRSSLPRASAGAKVLYGSELHPWKELQEVGAPVSDGLSGRCLTNLVHYRTNYAQLSIAWIALVTVRSPIRAVVVAVVSTAFFHGFVVRRGVVNLPTPNGTIALMGQQLVGVLCATSMLALLFFGCFWFLITALLPLLAAVLHAMCSRRPHSESSGAVSEFLLALHAALHDKELATDEMEGGMAEPAPFARDPELQRQVNEIRAKYRPPAYRKLNQD